ncbi:peroxiredoxin [Flavobacterium sp.]|uniref:peroxiredoxin n=1 Tax=Flavobacterium sp. TaxID=239 RepID=UPI00262528C4|nr:peroxiredoxin [Flavobacterium sp.]
MALQVGDSIPHFIAKDAAGKDFDSRNYIGKKPVVIYFYPKDDTRVCTQQACSFRDQYDDFKALGAEVIGISGDSIQSHQKFSAQYQLPFILLSDADRKLRKLFGVPRDLLGLIPGRVTYVANERGIITMIFNSTSGTIHIKKALEALQK